MSRHRRPLDAAELADAAITAALLATLLALELVLASSGFFPVLMATVVALLAARRRTRVVVMATAGAAALSVLLGGILPIAEVVLSGLLGWSVGTSLWRGRSRLATAGTALAVTWPVLAGASLAVLAVFGELRDLALDAARNQWDGMARFLRWAGLDTVAEDGTKIVDWSIDHWYVLFPAAEAVLTVLLALIVRSLARVVLVRVEQAIGPATAAATAEPAAGTTAGPVPIRLGDVTVARGQTLVRLGALDTTVARGELVCLVGTNGSGKTSLLRALAGLHPATGISSAGRVGLGEHGGTALISQRAETQVLGIRVIDDLRWGVPGLDDTDALAELARVGLDQLIERPTTDLSGGELQRLAIASALVRRPALLLSDEATAMLDPEGRRRVMAALTAASRTDAAVLHSTHVPADLEATDRVIEVGQAHTRPPPRRWGSARPAGDTILRAEGVAHVHGARTPWATPALAPVDLEVAAGQLVMVTGPNGSGKTTLARALAGLVRPTSGRVRLHGTELTGPDLRIGIAFQHARLQLLRATVGAEIRSASGHADIADAARAVGVDPPAMFHRRVDELSGGEQRRVLLAGLLARRCEIIVLDETLAGLDAAGRDELRDVLDEVLGRGVGVVLVTHDPEWAAERADAVIELRPM